MTRRPNLFIIGAMKAGTSSLHNYLDTHPEISMSEWKEPAFLASARPEGWTEWRYRGLFAPDPNARWRGESSTAYSKRPRIEGVAARIRRFSPSARIVYLMRDPFERLVSQYKHQIRAGVARRSLVESLSRPSGYLANSYYAFQLEPYLTAFGPDAVFTGTAESLQADPGGFLARVFLWLGVDAEFAPPNLDQRYHESPAMARQVVGGPLTPAMLLGLKRVPLLGRRALALRSWLVRHLGVSRELDFTSEDFRAETARLRATLAPMLAAWVRELEVLTGRSYTEWPTAGAPAAPDGGWTPPAGVWLPDEIRSRATCPQP